MVKKILKWAFLTFLLMVVVFSGWYFLQFPSLNRNWNEDQKILAEIRFNENLVHVKNARNFDYVTDTTFTPRYYDATYDINKLSRVWYIIEPFGDRDGPAHTMLSFDFSDGQHVSVSTEIRKEVGESFDAIKGLLRQYEIVYMIGDERDLIRLRSNYRKDVVTMYPLKIQPENLPKFFLSVMQRAQKLSQEPEWYNTITNTCATAIQDHANFVLDEERKISWNKNILLPKYSDEIAYNLGLIDTWLKLEEARKYYTINERSILADKDPEFSKKIRPQIQ
jgi:hypothetical protein